MRKVWLMSLILAVVFSGAASAADTYQYDAQGNAVSLEVTIDGLTLTVSAPLDGSITAPGMSTVQRVKNAQGRLATVKAGSTLFVSYEYDASGMVKAVKLPLGLSMTMQPAGSLIQQKVIGPTGVLTTVNVQDGYGPGKWHLFQLDMLLGQFGLNENDWFKKISITYNDTGTVVTVRNEMGQKIFYFVMFGPVRVGFDLSGRAIFYEIDATPEITNGVPTGLPPSRIIIAKDGRVQVQAPSTVAGAIESMWIDRDATGAQQRKYRTVQWVNFDNVSSPNPSPNLYAWCGSATTCTDAGSAGGSHCHTVNYWRPEDVPGHGCFDCDPRPTGGGGGGANPMNKIQNPMLRVAVNKAVAAAVTKLQSQACKDVLSKFTNPDGRTAKQTLDQKGVATESEWMRDFMQWYAAPNDQGCNGIYAYTTPGSTVVRVCSSFHNYQFHNPGRAADILIHEELHSLGLGEAPMPGQPSSLQIQAAVETACGVN